MFPYGSMQNEQWDKDIYFWITLSLLQKISQKMILKILENCNWSSKDCLECIKNHKNFRTVFPKENLVENILKDGQKGKYRIIAMSHHNYPKQLLDLEVPPLVIYVKGRGFDLNTLSASVAIVGSRKADTYGLKSAYKLAKEIASFGLTVISGLAIGIDSAAHKGALEAKGHTAAVLANGFNYCYPKANRKLQDEICEKGLLISEYPPERQPLQYYFPNRNRIIAALSRATVVVEAAKKSGAMITAKRALELNREVMAVPGNITTDLSEGPLTLLQEGAALIRSGIDILDALGVHISSNEAQKNLYYPENLGTNAKIILESLTNESSTVDYIADLCSLPPGFTYSALKYLETLGHVKRLNDYSWTKN